MKIKILLISICLPFFVLMSCSNDDTNDDINTISDQVERYLNEVLDIMEANSINKHNIDWLDFRTKVFEKVPGAQNIQDTDPAIREALVLLGDNHSTYFKADGSFIFVGTLQCERKDIVTPSLPDNIGYIKVNFFRGSSNSDAAIFFAQQLQDQIIEQDQQGIKGWIVDLRGNNGGNMWPMIAGIGPILGEGTAGYFIDPDNNQNSWGFQNGSSVSNGNPVTQLSSSYELIIPNPKVAVLLDNGISSSGEVMAISFIGREHTKSFGLSTCGLSTSNRSFTLSDNARLNLTTSYLADRNKNLFGIPIDPDLISTDEDIIQNAVDWIEAE